MFSPKDLGSDHSSYVWYTQTCTLFYHDYLTDLGLAINNTKTNYMVSTNRDMWRIGCQIRACNYSFDAANEFA